MTVQNPAGYGKSDTLIVTAADEAFGRTLLQYLRSAERRKLNLLHRFAVYDLGLSCKRRRTLERRFPWCRFKTFDFGRYPQHVNLARRNYAWKPIVIAEEFFAHDGVTLWFDCATLFKTDLAEIIKTVQDSGIWYLRGNSCLAERADARTLDALDVAKEALLLRDVCAGAIGFSASNMVAREIVRQWRDSALLEQVIDPQPGRQEHHRFDQSILSVLVLSEAIKGRLATQTAEVDISSHQPIRAISTRNKVDNRVPEAADFLVRLYYWSYKLIDCHWLRFSRWFSMWAGGIRRYCLEDFRISILDQERRLIRDLPSPPWGYFADPFVWQDERGTFVFAEEYEYAKDAGRLVVLELDSELAVKSHRPLTFEGTSAQITCHASFPFIFKYNGQFFMLPETSARRTIDLYRCIEWPVKWGLHRRLAHQIDAADTTIASQNGKNWLITSVRSDKGQRHLEVYGVDLSEGGGLLPHPVNTHQLFKDDRHGTGRSAGYLAVQPDGSLVRLMQSSTDHYGQGSAFRSIVKLDDAGFQELGCPPPPAFARLPNLERYHHLSTCGNLIAWDQRTRWSVLQLLWPWRRIPRITPDLAEKDTY